MKKVKKKGEFGYIDQTKILRLLATLVLFLIVAIILYTGYFKYHNTKNVFTVMAIVSVIPTAKIAVSYLVVMKYRSCDLALYEAVCKKAPDSLIVSDLLISSTEKVFQVHAAVVRDNSVYLYGTDYADTIKEKEAYIRQFLETEAKVTTVKLFCNQDTFLKQIALLNANSAGKFDETIKKLLCIYSL